MKFTDEYVMFVACCFFKAGKSYNYRAGLPFGSFCPTVSQIQPLVERFFASRFGARSPSKPKKNKKVKFNTVWGITPAVCMPALSLAMKYQVNS